MPNQMYLKLWKAPLIHSKICLYDFFLHLRFFDFPRDFRYFFLFFDFGLRFFNFLILFISTQSEILLKICSYLDLVSLSRVSQTCRKLHEVACDPSLYTELNLMPYWDVLDASVLKTFQTRCKYVKKVDLSWCSEYSDLSSSDVEEFIQKCGKQLTNLRMNSVKFLTGNLLATIALTCEHLTGMHFFFVERKPEISQKQLIFLFSMDRIIVTKCSNRKQ